MAVQLTRRTLALGLAAAAGMPTVTAAQSGKSLTIYVGFAAGGAVDLYARLVGKFMAQELGLASAIVQTNV
jgi:tripartite-type tricarboxylate transporter receptor subunit TctC